MIIHDAALKDRYYKKNKLDSWFSSDIYPYAELRSFEKGELLCRECEPLRTLYFLLKGRAKIYRTHSDGKVSLIEFCSPVAIIGEVELITGQTPVTVEAMEKCFCVSFPMEACREILLKDSVFLLRLCGYMGARVYKSEKDLVSGHTRSLKGRFCGFVLQSQVDGYFSEKLTETSEYLESSYRHVQRIVHDLCQRGVLTRTKQGYRIDDFEYLKKYCGA